MNFQWNWLLIIPEKGIEAYLEKHCINLNDNRFKIIHRSVIGKKAVHFRKEKIKTRKKFQLFVLLEVVAVQRTLGILCTLNRLRSNYQMNIFILSQ